jgi:hypothetical protein
MNIVGCENSFHEEHGGPENFAPAGEDQVATILPFLKEQNVFEPEVTRAMSEAFDEACRKLRLMDGAASEREVIAVRIIELARRGERDPARLCERVLREAGAP